MSTPVVQGIPPVGGGEQGPASTRGPARVAPLEADPRGGGDRDTVRSWFWRGLYLAVLFLATLAFVYPLVWLVSASLKPKEQVFDNRLVPETVQWSNFAAVWDAGPVLRWLFNSATVGLMAATAVTISSALVAFGFAYFRFRYRNLLFGLVLATMMLPGAVTMIPVYLIWNQVGMIDTQVPLWAQNLFGSAFYIFLLRQFFLGIPRELFEAARVDGASYLTMFRRIALPLARPALVIVFVFELAGELVGPDEAADLPADPRLLHDAARAEADRRRLRALGRVPLGDRHGGHAHRDHPDDPHLRVHPALRARRHRDERQAGLRAAQAGRGASVLERARARGRG